MGGDKTSTHQYTKTTLKYLDKQINPLQVACKALSHSLQPVDRRTLQHGVEALRCTGLHGLDVNLTMKLAKTFEMLSLDKDTLTNQVDEVEARAALYYRASLVSLELAEQGRAPREPITRLLPPAGGSHRSTLGKLKTNILAFQVALPLQLKLKK